jgi:hypothetical protein
MTKRRLILFLCLNLLWMVFACVSSAIGDGPGGVHTDTIFGVSVHTEQSNYPSGKSEICIFLQNYTNSTYAFDMEYMLQRKNGKTWEDVKKGETIVWVQAKFMLLPNHSEAQYIALSVYTDRIMPGDYRIVKPIKTPVGAIACYATAMFTVSD